MSLPVQSSLINKSFFQLPILEIAENLIGKGLFVISHGKPLLVEIVEVEAYLGSSDPASHAYRGITKRNWPMFERAGTCYVYLSYGINYCMNLVTGPKSIGEAILLRAARPLVGIEQMFKNRGMEYNSNEKTIRSLCNGPGKLTKALRIGLEQNGTHFASKDLRLVNLGGQNRAYTIERTPRIGISKGIKLPYRFVAKGSPYLSRITKPQ